jgi:hypothetical protein
MDERIIARAFKKHSTDGAKIGGVG